MILNLKRVSDEDGASMPFRGEVDMSCVKLWGTKPFDRPVVLSGCVFNRAKILSVDYTAHLDYNLMCARCLKRQRRVEDYRFRHILVQKLNDEDKDDFIVVPDGVLDIGELAVSDILLEMPSVVLCREDCKGLCPVCGADLNEKDCGCRAHFSDQRLQVLGDYFKQS